MPSSWKCPERGLVNFASDLNCKRCHAVAPASVAPSSPQPAGIVLEDGYVLPPPPVSGGIWRAGKILVMTKEAFLPDRCVKCNGPANGYRLRKRLSWHEPILYAVLVFAMLLYLILVLALSKRATVEFGLCQDHVRRRRSFLLAGWALFSLGLLIPVVAFTYEYVGVGLLGILLILAAIVWLVIAYKVANVRRIDDRYVWLTGINEQFLSQFPPVPAGPLPTANNDRTLT
jgi:hypothetical protein